MGWLISVQCRDVKEQAERVKAERKSIPCNRLLPLVSKHSMNESQWKVLIHVCACRNSPLCVCLFLEE